MVDNNYLVKIFGKPFMNWLFVLVSPYFSYASCSFACEERKQGLSSDTSNTVHCVQAHLEY